MDPQVINCEDDADAEISFKDGEFGSKLFSLLGKMNFEGQSVAAKACSDEFSSSIILPLGLLSRETMVKSMPLRNTEGLADFCSILLSSTFLPLRLLLRETMSQSTSLSQEEGIADFCSTEDLDLLAKLEIGIDGDQNDNIKQTLTS